MSMKSYKFFLIFTLLFIEFLPLTLSATVTNQDKYDVDIHISFMDEEASSALVDVLDSDQPVNIYVIERMGKDGYQDGNNELFQKPLHFYGEDIKVLHDANEFDPHLGKLSLNLEKIEQDDKKIQAIFKSDDYAPPKMGKGSRVGILPLRQHKDAKKTIFILRSPEMGMQPQLMELYLKDIYENILAYASDKEALNEITVNMIGTAGAVSPSITPGKREDVDGSFYVGVLKKGTKYHPVILFHDGTSEEKLIYQGKKKDDPNDAQKDLIEFWFNLAEKTQDKDSISTDPIYGKVMKKIKKITNNKKYKRIGQTVNFFDSSQFKKRSNIILGDKVLTVGMEDFQVLKTIHEANDKSGTKQLKTKFFQRIVANAQDVDDDLVQAYFNWHFENKKSCFSKEQYLEALAWGVNGSNPKRLPKSARWDVSDSSPIKGKLCKYGVVFDFSTHKQAPGLLNPYFAEISSDFLQSLRVKKAFNPIQDIVPNYEKLSPNEKEQISASFEKHQEKLAIMAESIIQQCRVKSCDESVFSKLVDELMYIPFPDCEKYTYCDKTPGGIPLLAKKEGTSTNACNMNIWIRNNKWNKGDGKANHFRLSNILEDIDDKEIAVKLYESSIDRMLFKGGLVAFAGGVKTMEQVNVCHKKHSVISQCPSGISHNFDKLKGSIQNAKEIVEDTTFDQ